MMRLFLVVGFMNFSYIPNVEFSFCSRHFLKNLFLKKLYSKNLKKGRHKEKVCTKENYNEIKCFLKVIGM